jgi:hypothetical protein
LKSSEYDDSTKPIPSALTREPIDRSIVIMSAFPIGQEGRAARRNHHRVSKPVPLQNCLHLCLFQRSSES